MKQRNKIQKLKDFITFPVRAPILIEKDRWGLSSLASERFDYVVREVRGFCLDVGCGRHNRFINDFLSGNGKGMDVFLYEGLSEENIVKDITHFPFPDASFDSVTFIANINHIPKSKRDAELREAYRCLKPGGNIIVTMGNFLAELLIHTLVWLYNKIFKINIDVDSDRGGMTEGEEYYLNDSEIVERLKKAGFKNIKKKYFLTQWGLNHLFVGWK